MNLTSTHFFNMFLIMVTPLLKQVKKILILFFLTNLFITIPTVSSQERPVVWWVLDCSGSMWGRTSQGPKYKTALELIRSSIDRFPDADYGLITFGRQDRSDCSDIELLVKPEQDSLKTLLNTLNKIRPLGKSPIAGALEFIGKQVSSERINFVILLTDGIESCEGNPVAAAQALRQNSAIKAVHTVVLDKTANDINILQNIAKASGGTCFTFVKIPPPFKTWFLHSTSPITVDTTITVSDVPRYGMIAYKAFIRRIDGFPAFGTKISVKLPDSTMLIERELWKGILEEIPPGHYFIEVSNTDTVIAQQCTVQAGKMTYLPFILNFPTGVIHFRCVVRGNAQIHAYNSIVQVYHHSGENVYMGNRWEGIIENLPIGKYRLTAVNQGYEVNHEIQVSIKDTIETTIDFPLETGRISYQCFLDSSLQKPAYGTRMKIFSLPFEEIIYDDSIRWRGQTPPIPIGSYILHGNFFGKLLSSKVNLNPNENVQNDIIFNVEQVRFSYECYRSVNNDPANGTVVSMFNAVGTRVEEAVGWRGTFTLPAGPYTLVAQYEGKEVRRPITLIPTFATPSPEKIYIK